MKNEIVSLSNPDLRTYAYSYLIRYNPYFPFFYFFYYSSANLYFAYPPYSMTYIS